MAKLTDAEAIALIRHHAERLQAFGTGWGLPDRKALLEHAARITELLRGLSKNVVE